jgi:hypothetical protein
LALLAGEAAHFLPKSTFPSKKMLAAGLLQKIVYPPAPPSPSPNFGRFWPCRTWEHLPMQFHGVFKSCKGLAKL